MAILLPYKHENKRRKLFMIITLKGANFADSNIGTLSTWTISRVLGDGATYDGAFYVDKNAALNATVTIAEGYELNGSVTVTMGGEGQAFTHVGNVITISIASVTGNVSIKVPTKKVGTTGGEDGGIDEELITYEFPLRTGGVGITSTGTGRLSTGETRLCNGSTTEKLGILIPAGSTLTFKGLASGTYPLRFDYVYGTVNAFNPVANSSTPIEGLVGTASCYVSDDYFMLNINGTDSYSVTNSSDKDYYYWFVFAGLTKNEVLNTEINTYNITYTISSNVNWLDLPVTNLALGVTNAGTGRATDNDTRLSTANTSVASGILIPAGKTMYLKGLASGTYPLRFDYVYGTVNAVNPASGSTTPIEGLVGTASNYVPDNYFCENTKGADIWDVTNTSEQDYYYWFGFAGLNKSEKIKAEINTYDIKYYIA
jgi:hypothetical protein